MRIIGVQSRVSPFLIAVVLLLQLSPALATGQPDAQQATIQGSRFPGMPVPSTETTRDKRRGPVEVTFTKWRTAWWFRHRRKSERGHSLRASSEAISAKGSLSGRFSIAR